MGMASSDLCTKIPSDGSALGQRLNWLFQPKREELGRAAARWERLGAQYACSKLGCSFATRVIITRKVTQGDASCPLAPLS